MASVSAPCAVEIEIGYEHNDGTEHAQFHGEKRAAQAAERRELADLQGRLADRLAAQTSGATSQRLIEAHQRAKIFRHTVADGHEVKARAYETAAAIYTRYGSVKRDIIIEAQKQIDQLERSKAPAPVKVAQREAIIVQARADLGYQYAQAVANMAEAGQNILNQTGRGSSSIHDHVQPLGSGTGGGGGGSHGPLPTGGPRIQAAAYGVQGGDKPPPLPNDVGGVVGQLVAPAVPPPAGPAPSAPSTPASPAAPVPRVPSAPITSMAPGGVAGGAGGRMPIPGLSPGGASAVSAAMSGVARAVPAVVVPPVVVAPHIAGPVSAAAPVLDHGGLVSHAAASAPMPAPAAAPVAPPGPGPGPLPPYGSDVRMVANTSPAIPPVTPPMSGQGLAAGPMVGPAVVPTVAAVVPTPTPAPSAMTSGQAVLGQTSAASFGAVAGRAAAESVAQARCDGFAAAMSGQEPRLRWMAATRANGVTVVATDLGGGWVPPGVGVPRAADLPAPGSLVSWRELQRGSAFHAAFTPGQGAAVAADSGAGVALGDGPRKLEPVSDLGWQLRQATQWRDGLPRVAHTLATAWTKGGGAMPAEMEQLQGALAAQRETVLNDYARGEGEVDPHELGNWMLLSTIDAVHRNQLMLADYHFRWFGTTVRT